MLVTFKKTVGSRRIYVMYHTCTSDVHNSGIIWRKTGVCRLKGVGKNNDQGICSMCSKEETEATY
jgi:hypothetical protein